MPKLLEPIAVHLAAARLDAELAAGTSAEAGPLHARRARTLVAPRARRSLARSWEHLLSLAAQPPHGLSGRVPIRRARVLHAEPEIRALIDALEASGPVPARGVALARQLLTDGAGPVYNRAAADDLAERVAQAALELDPARPLLPAPTPLRPASNPSLQLG